MSDWILAALVSGFGFKGLPTVHPSAHLLNCFSISASRFSPGTLALKPKLSTNYHSRKTGEIKMKVGSRVDQIE